MERCQIQFESRALRDTSKIGIDYASALSLLWVHRYINLPYRLKDDEIEFLKPDFFICFLYYCYN